MLTLMHMEDLTGWSQFYTPVPLPFQHKPYLPSVESSVTWLIWLM